MSKESDTEPLRLQPPLMTMHLQPPKVTEMVIADYFVPIIFFKI